MSSAKYYIISPRGAEGADYGNSNVCDYYIDGSGSVKAVSRNLYDAGASGLAGTAPAGAALVTYDTYGVRSFDKVVGSMPSGGLPAGTIHGYRGHRWDDASGLYVIGARMYDAEAGSWTQEDPARCDGNYYSYCGGNPTSWWDPSGLCKERTSNLDVGGNRRTGPNGYEGWDYTWADINCDVAAHRYLNGEYDGIKLCMIGAAYANPHERNLPSGEKIYVGGPRLYSREEEAVKAFADLVNRSSIINDWEYATFIYRVNGKYSFFNPWTDRKQSVQVTEVVDGYSSTYNVTATVHTHGKFKVDIQNPWDNEDFSPPDIRNNDARIWNSYLVIPAGRILKYVRSGESIEFSHRTWHDPMVYLDPHSSYYVPGSHKCNLCV